MTRYDIVLAEGRSQSRYFGSDDRRDVGVRGSSGDHLSQLIDIPFTFEITYFETSILCKL